MPGACNQSAINHARPSDEVRYFRPATIPGMEVMMLRQCNIHWRLLHDRYTIGVATSAASDWRYSGKNHFIRDGVVMFLEPGESQIHTTMHKPMSGNAFVFDQGVLESAAQELGIGTPHFRMAQAEDPKLFRSFERLYKSIHNNESALEQQSRFYCCLRLLLASHVERARSIHKYEETGNRVDIMRVEMYLREHFNEPISLQRLSDVAGLSRFHLLRMFSRHFGIPPHAYQNALRMSHARSLLGEGASAATAAAATGFADQSHLARHYKKFFGATPNQYATMVRR